MYIHHDGFMCSLISKRLRPITTSFNTATFNKLITNENVAFKTKINVRNLMNIK